MFAGHKTYVRVQLDIRKETQEKAFGNNIIQCALYAPHNVTDQNSTEESPVNESLFVEGFTEMLEKKREEL